MSKTIAELGEAVLRRLGVAIVAAADRPPLTVTIPAATIATTALVELGVIAADETPAPADQTLALAKLSAMHDALVAQGNVSWALSAVPRAVSEEYAKLTALAMASSFGKPADPAMLGLLEGRVRKAAMLMDAPALAVDTVQSLHDTLAAQGRVRWSVFDIPAGVEDAYIMKAAANLAPYFGQPADKAEEIEAQRILAQAIALPTSGERTRAEYF